MNAEQILAKYIENHFVMASYGDYTGIKNCDNYEKLVMLKELVKNAINELKYGE